MTPTISAVIPHHNCPDLLRRALASIAAQTVPVHEIIVVDDASSDPTLAEEAETITKEFKGTTFLRLDSNAGPGGARNAGWDRATGDWVALCDADDTWHPRKIERQMALLGQGVSIVGATRITLEDGGQWPDLDDETAPRLITLDRMTLNNPFPTSSVVLRRDIPVRFTEGRRYAEDYEVWIKAVASGKAWFQSEPLCAQYKAAYGDSGLSSHMGKMVKGEFETIGLMGAQGHWNKRQVLKARCLLTLRVARRYVLLGARRAGFSVRHGHATVTE